MIKCRPRAKAQNISKISITGFHLLVILENVQKSWTDNQSIFLSSRDLSNNKLTQVPTWMFHFCKNLTELYVKFRFYSLFILNIKKKKML